MQIDKPLKYFTIIGERCSGTTFIECAIKWNFKLEYYPTCRKHFFGHDNSVFDSEKMKETLVIYVTRDPVEWIDSLFKRLHHVAPQNKKSIYNFLNNEFYSIHELEPVKWQELMEDRNIITKERYRNIFELRKVKNNFILETLPKLVDNVQVIRYENLRENYEVTLEKLYSKYNLERLWDHYKTIPKYKGTYLIEYFKKPILINEKTQKYIKNTIDKEQEDLLIQMSI
jgi:hypothetical protein